MDGDIVSKSVGELRIVTPVGMLGYGIPVDDLRRGLDAGADAVIVDSGSTDPGPYQLGLDLPLVPRASYLRDLTTILDEARPRGIPVYIGSAGGAGLNQQVDWMVDIVREIARKGGYPLRVAKIYAEVPKAVVQDRLRAGRIEPCGAGPDLTPEDVDGCTNIVAQMGAEPFLRAMQADPAPDVIVGGRAYDPAPFAALCAKNGIDPGIYWHMGKIMECGAVCAEPKGKVILGTAREGSFDLVPMNPKERCTPVSVASHTFYEKSHPTKLAGPGGILDIEAATYKPLDARTVRVEGGVFAPSDPYKVKLEGAGPVGYRTIFIGATRDPILIGQIDAFQAEIHEILEKTFPEIASGEASFRYHTYGKDGVMGPFEPTPEPAHELAMLGEAVAPTQELAAAICSTARVATLHHPYPGQMATAGNIALPLSPPETDAGPVCAFLIYHLMEVDDPVELFPIAFEDI